MDSVPIRVQAAVYATGLFSATQTGLIAVVVPLWLLHLDASPVMIGHPQFLPISKNEPGEPGPWIDWMLLVEVPLSSRASGAASFAVADVDS